MPLSMLQSPPKPKIPKMGYAEENLTTLTDHVKTLSSKLLAELGRSLRGLIGAILLPLSCSGKLFRVTVSTCLALA
jgi:hypothetical protein